jgi:hypothetical protein
MLVDMVAVHVMQVTVVQIVLVALVADRGVSAAGPVSMQVTLVNLVIVHAPSGDV